MTLWIPRLFDSFGWVPDALELANIDDLARVVGVVGTNASYRGGPQLKLLVVSGLDSFLPFGEDFVELLDDVGPLGGVEVVEGLVVVAAEFGWLLALEAGQRFTVPEEEMIGELAYGVVAGAGGPLCLFGGKAFDGNVDGDEPVLLGVGGAELVKEDASEGGRCLRGRRVLRADLQAE
jgi:hypothetical protein